jgi:hypothetical protein
MPTNQKTLDVSLAQGDDSLFDAWADLNLIVASWRSRFDGVREGFKTCKTEAEAKAILGQEGFLSRYSLLPDCLK